MQKRLFIDSANVDLSSAKCFYFKPKNIGSTPKSVDFKGQHQSQWILMKDAAWDKDPQSIIFKVFIAVG